MSTSTTKKLPNRPTPAHPKSQNPSRLSGSTLKGSSKSFRTLPERYTIKAAGDERVLICLEAPNLNVHIEAGLSVTGSVARRSPEGTIFLDGVAQCEPFMDHERQVYNLDHHEGCVRAFTLATCEQALVMYMKGIDLQGREWNIYVNEPDLDAVLALWIILNHGRIGRQETTQRRILFALVRYEGVIDALGLELRELCALPPDLVRKIHRVVDHLRSEEIALKKEGRWEETDHLAYTVSILHKIDQIFYKPGDFADYKGVEELARIDITDQRIAAVVEADMGIYEIEPHLNKLYGNRLGVVFLKKGAASYTARQMDLFMPITLEDIYERLNFVDPAVKCRTQTNKWGGANDIGGSPRESGTGLTPAEIAHTCREAVNRLSAGQQTYRFGVTAALAGLLVMIATITRIYWDPARWLGRGDLSVSWTIPDTGFVVTLLLTTLVALAFISYCRPWQYGLISPSGVRWWLFMPVAIVAGVAGGVWTPHGIINSGTWPYIISLGFLGIPLVAELLFRGLAHGLLTQGARIQRNDTHWFVSWPVLGSTIMYVGFILLVSVGLDPGRPTPQPWHVVQALVSAAIFGIAMGMVRERSQSVYPALLFHCLAAATAILIVKLI